MAPPAPGGARTRLERRGRHRGVWWRPACQACGYGGYRSTHVDLRKAGVVLPGPPSAAPAADFLSTAPLAACAPSLVSVESAEDGSSGSGDLDGALRTLKEGFVRSQALAHNLVSSSLRMGSMLSEGDGARADDDANLARPHRVEERLAALEAFCGMQVACNRDFAEKFANHKPVELGEEQIKQVAYRTVTPMLERSSEMMITRITEMMETVMGMLVRDLDSVRSRLALLEAPSGAINTTGVTDDIGRLQAVVARMVGPLRPALFSTEYLLCRDHVPKLPHHVCMQAIATVITHSFKDGVARHRKYRSINPLENPPFVQDPLPYVIAATGLRVWKLAGFDDRLRCEYWRFRREFRCEPAGVTLQRIVAGPHACRYGYSHKGDYDLMCSIMDRFGAELHDGRRLLSSLGVD